MSVCFCCFDTGPKHRNKPKQTETNQKKIFGVSWKSKPNNNRNRSSFGLFRFFKPRNKINGFEDPLIENVFWRFFWFVSVCFEKILFVSVVSIPVRNTETNRKKCFLVSRNKPKKMFFGFAKQTEKQPKQKKIWLFRGHPSTNPSGPGPDG
jgi:hypothetical protein